MCSQLAKLVPVYYAAHLSPVKPCSKKKSFDQVIKCCIKCIVFHIPSSHTVCCSKREIATLHPNIIIKLLQFSEFNYG